MSHSHNGKVDVAPCGHTGEVIIGTYVRCLVGCEGAPVMPKRGVVGHVDNCACKPCQIRRAVTHIVLRDKNGKDWLKVEWDGVTDLIEMEATKSGTIRGFHFLDKDGKVVAKGITEANLIPGKMKIKPMVMVDAIVACAVAKSIVDEQDFLDVMAAAVNKIRQTLGLPALAPAQPGTMVTPTTPGFP